MAGTGYTGEDGVECAVPAALATELWETVVAAGAVPAGLGARDTLRLEAGLPLHGHELGPGITPLEAGLSWVVAWDKPGGFTGLEALLEQRQRGVPRVLKGITGEGRQPLRAGYALTTESERVGELTSGNFSPVLGRGIGMGFLSPDVPEGAVLEVEARGRQLPGRVTRLPFIKRALAPLVTRQVAFARLPPIGFGCSKRSFAKRDNGANVPGGSASLGKAPTGPKEE